MGSLADQGKRRTQQGSEKRVPELYPHLIAHLLGIQKPFQTFHWRNTWLVRNELLAMAAFTYHVQGRLPAQIVIDPLRTVATQGVQILLAWHRCATSARREKRPRSDIDFAAITREEPTIKTGDATTEEHRGSVFEPSQRAHENPTLDGPVLTDCGVGNALRRYAEFAYPQTYWTTFTRP